MPNSGQEVFLWPGKLGSLLRADRAPGWSAFILREGRWVVADLHGKDGRVRTVAIPLWVKQAIDARMVAAKIEKGRLLRPLWKSGKMIGDKLGDWAIWSVVEQSAKEIGI